MKTFTVAEVAEALETDLVTVRRWIAKGEKGGLRATIDSKKGGYRITEEALKQFLSAHVKYARLAASSPLLMEIGKSSIGAAALARVLKRIGSLPVSEALSSLDGEIEKAKQQKEEKEQEIKTIKENIAALQVIRTLLENGGKLPSFEED
jgi:excisionase family DNA binding protein